MLKKEKLINMAKLFKKLWMYNLKIVFSNRFLYFVLAAIGFLALVIGVQISSGTEVTAGTLFNFLLLPGILLVFYSSTFGIQNDTDQQMLEVIFGIPDYRYKVWLFRLFMSFTLVGLILFFISIISSIIFADIPIFRMVFHLLFPVLFLGCVAFWLSTWIRNAYGASVILVLFGLAFWLFRSDLASSQWNIFLNPFLLPSGFNEEVWQEVIRTNRFILFGASVCALLASLLNLQKREKFL